MRYRIYGHARRIEPVTELERLETRIRMDMAEIGQPLAIRSALSIARRYAQHEYDVPEREIEAAVRRIARPLQFTVF